MLALLLLLTWTLSGNRQNVSWTDKFVVFLKVYHEHTTVIQINLKILFGNSALEEDHSQTQQQMYIYL